MVTAIIENWLNYGMSFYPAALSGASQRISAYLPRHCLRVDAIPARESAVPVASGDLAALSGNHPESPELAEEIRRFSTRL